MDGTLWAIAAAIGTPLSAGIAWICNKAWKLVEDHAERRTKAFEAIAPSVKTTFDEMRKHVTEHADKHAEAVQRAETNIIASVNTARSTIVESIELAKRLERVESALVKPKDVEDPTPERSEHRASRSNVQPLRESRPAAATR